LEVEPYDIPLTFRLGLAYDVLDRPGSKWTMAVEATHPNDNDQQASFGTEYGYEDRLFVRGGYKFNRDEDGITLGAGVRTPLGNTTDFLFDYAWSDFGRLDSIHRLSIGFNF
jgi:long-subunit fatty acid transport protein